MAARASLHPLPAHRRDYAAGDLAQERLEAAGRQQQLGPGFFVRWDGTCAYYFTEVWRACLPACLASLPACCLPASLACFPRSAPF